MRPRASAMPTPMIMLVKRRPGNLEADGRSLLDAPTMKTCRRPGARWRGRSDVGECCSFP